MRRPDAGDQQGPVRRRSLACIVTTRQGLQRCGADAQYAVARIAASRAGRPAPDAHEGDRGTARAGRPAGGAVSREAHLRRAGASEDLGAGPREATDLGIEIVYQDLALCDNLDIVHNMFLGREKKKGITLNEEEMEALARKTLDGLSVRTVKSIRQTVSSLSGGQRQTVAIARAVLWNSKVVILDEPTAALGVAQTEQVLNLVRRLADNGLAVILISHNLNDIFQVADNIAALYLGNMAAQVKKNDVTHAQVVQLITTGKTAGVA